MKKHKERIVLRLLEELYEEGQGKNSFNES